MTCIIVDDEPLAIDLLDDFIKRIPFLNLIAKCKNAFEAINALQHNTIDLIFLDIQMPNISGIQLLQGLEKKPVVIFTTAYSQYAVESYNLNAIDYLLKPFTFDRFFKAVNKAFTTFNYQQPKKEQLDQITENQHIVDPQFIFVKSDYRTLKINLNEILYIEGLKDYVKIYTPGKHVLTLQSLKALEETLPKKKFIRVHRSFIIAISKIDSIERGIILIGQARIPVGDSYREEFQKMIGYFEK